MRYSERERDPYRDNDEDYRAGVHNGGRYGETRHGGEEDEFERSRRRRGFGEPYSSRYESREEWPRQSVRASEERPSWLRGRGGYGDDFGGYGGTSTYGSTYGSPYSTSFNDPWFRERAWRPEPGWSGRGSMGEQGYGGYEGGYADQGPYGSQYAHGGYGPSRVQSGYGYESREGGFGYGGQGGYESEHGYRGEGGYGGGQSFGGRSFGRQGRFGSGEYGSQGRPGSYYGEGHVGYRGGYGSSSRSGGSWGSGYGSMSGQEGIYGRGSHYGRGPKGYQRSDERLREEISDRLMADPDIDATQIQVDVKNGEVTLEGTVEDRRTKREVEDLVEEIMGVKDTTNRLRVQAQSPKLGEGETEGPSWTKSGATSGSTGSGTTSSKSGKSYNS